MIKSETKEYQAWCNMRHRCLSNQRYIDRGITVCPQWETFEVFLEDMGECPEGLSLERKDNNLGYFPSNCCWATRSQQCVNRSPFGKHIWKSHNKYFLRIQLRPGFRYVKGFLTLEEAESERADCLFEREIYKRLA